MMMPDYDKTKREGIIISSGKSNLSERVEDIVSGREDEEKIRVLSEALEKLDANPDLPFSEVRDICKLALERFKAIERDGI